MPAVETVAGGIGGDDALNADLLGSLRDTVRHRDFSRHPSDGKNVPWMWRRSRRTSPSPRRRERPRAKL